MTLNAGMQLEPRLGLAPTPALVAYARLLALPGAELEQAVAGELAHNPALIQDEAAACGSCGMPAEPPCPYCTAWAGGPVMAESGNRGGLLPGAGPAVRVPWTESILRDLRLALPGRDAGLAAVVVASLDERGYLTDEVPGIAQAASADVASVERVIQVLRETGPPGVGARDLRDCLLLQIDRLGPRRGGQPVARAIVDGHLSALARGATASIARQLGVPPSDIVAARQFIRRELLPRPAQSGAGDPDAVPVRPDVAVRPSAGQPGAFQVDVLEEQRMVLRVDPYFRHLAAESATVSELVRKGDFFLARLRERWTTMRRITDYVIAQRPGLVTGGPVAGPGLTRTAVAAGLGLNPSTVSRATGGRYVLLPSRRLLPYAAFFDGSLDVCAQLKEIIAAESRPLSDSELCERLERAGHRVARRTVAKYRSQLRVLPSTSR